MLVWLGLKWRVRARRLVSLLLLICFCASFLPLSVGSRSPVKKDRSAPYPCQNRPCGCRSAKQCWKSCCCFSNREKLAWAKSKGVIPPTYVVEAAAQESVSPVCQTEGCCSKQQKPVVAKITGAAAPVADCCTQSDQPEKTSHSENSNQEDQQIFIIGILAQKCQGQGHFWNGLPWAILPEVQEIVPCSKPVIWGRPISSSRPQHSVEPPEPPPRLLVNTTVIV